MLYDTFILEGMVLYFLNSIQFILQGFNTLQKHFCESECKYICVSYCTQGRNNFKAKSWYLGLEEIFITNLTDSLNSIKS